MSERQSSNAVWHNGHVTSAERAVLLGQQPATFWFTGLSGAGKSTIAFLLERELVDRGRACYVLDGDNVRHGLNRDLGFTATNRSENIRRIAEVAKLMNDAGLIVMAAFISPYRSDRAMAKEIIGADRFIEVHLDTPIEVCEQRDAKGMYKKARAGLIADFTGISAPYEAPEAPSLELDTSKFSREEALAQLIGLLPENG
ncbi:adenylyl-sulfate kinase [Sideroxydans sp.]